MFLKNLVSNKQVGLNKVASGNPCRAKLKYRNDIFFVATQV